VYGKRLRDLRVRGGFLLLLQLLGWGVRESGQDGVFEFLWFVRHVRRRILRGPGEPRGLSGRLPAFLRRWILHGVGDLLLMPGGLWREAMRFGDHRDPVLFPGLRDPDPNLHERVHLGGLLELRRQLQ